MNADILIVGATPDKKSVDDLYVELELLGADVVTGAVASFANLETQIKSADQNYAMTLLFVTETFVQSLERTDTTLKVVPKSVAIMGFGLNKEKQKAAESRLPGIEFSSSKTLGSFARGAITELAKPHRAKRLAPATGIKTIWKSPLYIFKASAGLDPEDDKEILIDVTWSAKPTRPEMSQALVSALRATFDHLGNRKLKILDFGAGKLRHTIPLLKKGHSVDAVDYRSLFERPSPEIKKNLQEARQFKEQFAQLIYPADFAKLAGQYDLIMAVNVLNVMPEPLERYFVLQKCNQNLAKGGYLLWFCQHGDSDQLNSTKDLRITDGGCTAKKGRKTFYKDYNSRDLILRMMDVMGFEYVPLKIDSGKNHAILLRRTKDPAIDVNLIIQTARQALGRKVHAGEMDSEIAVADVLDGSAYVGYGGALAAALDNVGPGKKTAYKYENLVAPIIEYVFQKEFIRATIEKQYVILSGKQRVDIKAEYRESSPLRSALVIDTGLNSNWIPIECKNYSKQLDNPEYAQIVMRCHKERRRFAIIFCRDVRDRTKVNKTCHEISNQHGYLVAVFDDSDVKNLLQMADQEQFDDIRNAIVKRTQEVLDLAN